MAGVYATRPGVLLSDLEIDNENNDRIPMAVVGVVPTKVTSEGGPIHRGDLLVTSSLPGHAMKANPEQLLYGVVLGKALQTFEGSDSGVIEVLVSVR